MIRSNLHFYFGENVNRFRGNLLAPLVIFGRFLGRTIKSFRIVVGRRYPHRCAFHNGACLIGLRASHDRQEIALGIAGVIVFLGERFNRFCARCVSNCIHWVRSFRCFANIKSSSFAGSYCPFIEGTDFRST